MKIVNKKGLLLDIQQDDGLKNRNSNFILKWTTVLVIIASLSKVLGFAREATIAYVYGANIQTDAFFIALLLPGLIFTAFHEAINRAFIPVYGSLRRYHDSNIFVNSAGLILFLMLVVLFIIIQVVAPLLARIMAPGFSGDALELTTQLIRIVAVSLFFNGFSGIISGYLRAQHIFLGAALTGLPLNIVIILGALIWGSQYGIFSLAYLTVVGYLLALLILIPWLVKTDYRIGGGIDFRNRGIRELRMLLPPLVLAGAASEIKALVDRMFASLLPAGGVSALNYAARVRDLPVSIFVGSYATVLFPTLVDLASENKLEEFKKTLLQSLRIILFVMLPLATLTFILGQPIIRFVFERGAFTAGDTNITATILIFFSIGMVGDALNQILNRAFFALKDLRTPMRITILLAAMNLVLNAILIGPLKHAGIALSTSLCFLTGAVLSFYYLSRRIRLDGLKVLIRTASLSLSASVVMGFSLKLILDYWQNMWLPLSFIDQLLQLAILGFFSLGLYLLLMWLLKSEEIRIIPELIVLARGKNKRIG